jgi:hypothetical protein
VSFLAVGLALSCSDDDDDDDHGGSNNDDDNDVNDDDDNNNNDDESDDDDNNDNDDFVDDDLGPCDDLYPNAPTFVGSSCSCHGERCEFPVESISMMYFLLLSNTKILIATYLAGKVAICSREVNGVSAIFYQDSGIGLKTSPVQAPRWRAFSNRNESENFVPSTEIDGYGIGISDSCTLVASSPKFEVTVIDGKSQDK